MAGVSFLHSGVRQDYFCSTPSASMTRKSAMAGVSFLHSGVRQDYFCSTPSASMTRKSAMCLFFSTHAPRPLSQVLSRAALFG